jgi:hypothetical protein
LTNSRPAQNTGLEIRQSRVLFAGTATPKDAFVHGIADRIILPSNILVSVEIFDVWILLLQL